MSEKIRPTHRHRTAYVSVRQSSPHPVRSHHESQRRQYALADRARAWAWGSSWPPCVRGVAGWSSRWKRHAWRGTTETGTI